jgi:hypothetical protein
MFRNILDWLLDILKWFFWTAVTLLIIFFTLGLVETAWPGSLGMVLPEVAVFVSSFVVQAVGLLLIIFIIISLIRGGRLNILDLIELWDNAKDRKTNKDKLDTDFL